MMSDFSQQQTCLYRLCGLEVGASDVLRDKLDGLGMSPAEAEIFIEYGSAGPITKENLYYRGQAVALAKQFVKDERPKLLRQFGFIFSDGYSALNQLIKAFGATFNQVGDYEAMLAHCETQLADFPEAIDDRLSLKQRLTELVNAMKCLDASALHEALRKTTILSDYMVADSGAEVGKFDKQALAVSGHFRSESSSSRSEEFSVSAPMAVGGGRGHSGDSSVSAGMDY